MSNEIKTGGSAFPYSSLAPDPVAGGLSPTIYADSEGMTLRDYFAAKAMQTMCGGNWPDSNDRPEIAKRAYLMADEMLKAREA